MNINKAMDKAYENLTLNELVELPISALEGISEKGGEALSKYFKVKTIKDLAELKVIKRAQSIVSLAEAEEQLN